MVGIVDQLERIAASKRGLDVKIETNMKNILSGAPALPTPAGMSLSNIPAPLKNLTRTLRLPLPGNGAGIGAGLGASGPQLKVITGGETAVTTVTGKKKAIVV